MKARKHLVVFTLLIISGWLQQALACHNSYLSLLGVSYDSQNHEYVIQTRLHVGGGRTGTVLGANADTRSITFGFFKNCSFMTLNSYTPNQIVGVYTGCTMPASSIGPQLAPFYSQQTLIYIDPGYYGVQPCFSQPFACINSTANCGNVTSAPYDFTFRTNMMPDSIRVFGVEGGGSPLSGCYPQSDLMLDFCQNGCNNLVISCPPPQQIPAGPSCLGIVPNFTSLASFPPNCNVTGTPVITQSPVAGSVTGAPGTVLMVSLFAQYANVGSASCCFNATVTDLTGPTVTCPGNFTITANSGCNGILGNYTGLGTITDNCDPNPSIFSQHPPSGHAFSGTTNVHLLGTDNHGNVDSCAFLVAVAELTPPVLTCPGNQAVTLNPQCEYNMPSYLGLAIATDNCTVSPTLSQSPPAGTVFSGPGTQTVSVTATDGAGNSATCTFTVTSTVASPPQIVCPSNVSTVVNANCTGVVGDFTNGVSYNFLCAPRTFSVVQSPLPGTSFSGVTSVPVTLTATDSLGFQTTCTFPLALTDNSPPTIVCPPNDTVYLGGSCQYVIADFRGMAVTADNCGPVTVSQVVPPGSVASGTGTGPIHLTATDASGNTSSCAFLESCLDSMRPTIICPTNQVLTLDAQCQAVIPSYVGQASAFDNCSAVSSITQSPAVGSWISGTAPQSIVLSVHDVSGNVATCSFMVTGVDAMAPSLVCPPNATLVLDANCQAVIPNYTLLAVVTDNCSPLPTMGQQPAAGTLITIPGAIPVTLTATDAAGQSTTCSFNVTGQEITPPTIVCPPNATLPLDLNCQLLLPNYALIALVMDNCTASPMVSQQPPSGTVYTMVGNNLVTLTATDGAGNSSTCSFAVAISPPQILGTTVPSTVNPCEGDTVTLTALGGNLSYGWSTGALGQVVQVTTTGWYWVDVSGAPGCTARDSIFLQFAPLPQPNLTQVGNSLCTGTFSTYQWYLNGSAIPGATGACTPILTTGAYAVEVTDANGCVGTSAMMNAVGMDDPHQTGFLVFPVPAQDVLYIQLPQAIEASGEVMLYDIAGKLVRRLPFERLEMQTAFPLQGLADGSYFLEVKAAGYSGMKKVLKLK